MKKEKLIGIDALGIDQPGGARTAVFFLFRKLFTISRKWNFRIYVSAIEEEFARYPNVEQIVLPFRKGVISRLGAQIYYYIESMRYKFDVFHFTKSQGALLYKTRCLITIFDMTVLNEPKMFNKLDVYFWTHIQPILIKKYQKIIAISYDVKKDLVKYYNIDPKMIEVIYCSSQFDQVIPFDRYEVRHAQRKYNLPLNYFLYLGIIALKKNLSTLIYAYLEALQNDRNLPELILAGPYYPKSDGSCIFELIKKLHLEEKVKYIGKADFGDLVGLYQGALLFIMPSVHEGFGIPVLEAMQCGVPVITSNVASLPEVVGIAGVLVDEYMSSKNWKEAINLVSHDHKLRKNMIEQGYKQSLKFSWEKSAQQLKDLYSNWLQ